VALLVGQPLPVAVQFDRQAMRLPYNFPASWIKQSAFIRAICGLYFPLIESNQFARKNFFSVGKNVFEGAMIGRNVVVI
jgi:hypothetical protein